MSTNSKEYLRASFKEVGKRYGYESVDAEFAAFKDFKVSWERSFRTASFHVSDYLSDAPKAVFDSLAESMFSKIMGVNKLPYTEEMKEWTLSDRFITTKQPVYMRRSKNLSGSSVGFTKDLEESLFRLKTMGLVDMDAAPKLSWTRVMLDSKIGFCSPVMNVIAVSCILDVDDVPDYVVDFVVYREYLILEEGRRDFGLEPKGTYRDVEVRFPRYEEVIRWLSRANLR